MKRKIKLLGIITLASVGLIGCDRMTSSEVEGVIYKKVNEYRNTYAIVYYEGYYDKVYSDYISANLSEGTKLKLIKKVYKSSDGNIRSVELVLP